MQRHVRLAAVCGLSVLPAVITVDCESCCSGETHPTCASHLAGCHANRTIHLPLRRCLLTLQEFRGKGSRGNIAAVVNLIGARWQMEFAALTYQGINDDWLPASSVWRSTVAGTLTTGYGHKTRKLGRSSFHRSLCRKAGQLCRPPHLEVRQARHQKITCVHRAEHEQ